MYGEPTSPPPVNSPPRRGVNPQSPVYAIDFGAQAAGKRIATTKRRIRWRWGFSNSAALSEGQSGTACRGEEHEIVLVWSVTSGKRQITMDGQEVHYSTSRSNVIDFSWTMKGNHVLKLSAMATSPVQSTPGTYRQYDLFIDGQSFFAMPKVYELGLRGSPQAHARVPGDVGAYRSDPRGAQEEADLQRAIQESITESRRHLESKGRSTDSYGGSSYAAPSPAPHDQSATTDLLGFAGDSNALAPAYAPAPVAPGYPPAPAYAPAPAAPGYPPAPAYAPAPAPYAPAVPALTYGAPAPAAPYPGAPAAGAPAPPVYTAPAPYAPAPQAYAPAPQPYAPASYAPATPNSVQPQQSAYPGGELLSPGVTSTASAPPAYGFPVQQPMHSLDDPFAPRVPTQTDMHSAILNAYGGEPPTTPAGGTPAQPNFSTPQATPTGGPSLSMNAPLAIEETANQPKSEFDSALKNLVNFDDITSPAEGELKLTMIKKEEAKKKKGNKSQPIAPAANRMVGSHATLSQIQTVKGGQSSLTDPSKVMKAAPGAFHQDAQYAGALVVHGQGPPPLRPQGFGVVHGQGYGHYGQ